MRTLVLLFLAACGGSATNPCAAPTALSGARPATTPRCRWWRRDPVPSSWRDAFLLSVQVQAE